MLLADPIVDNLNALGDGLRAAYLDDMVSVGDALIRTTGADRINYETLGNACPVLHTHITPRYTTEGALSRRMSPAFLRLTARRTTGAQRAQLKAMLRTELAPRLC